MDTGFWMQYYVPLYEQIYNQNLFKDLAYLLSDELIINDVAKAGEFEWKWNSGLVTDKILKYLNLIKEAEAYKEGKNVFY